MLIRPATTEDVPAVLPMVAKICALHQAWDPAKYGFRDQPAERYRRWMTTRADDPRSVFLVAQREANDVQPSILTGFVIGTVETEIPIYQLKEYGFLHDLWVEEAYRHEGIGRQLVMRAIEQFVRIGVPQVRLDTAAANEPARELFRACGFRVDTMEMLLKLPDAPLDGDQRP
ncbi:MAG: GNAT family N-acetyltransferase [Phycisphaerales bacterium]|nr:GNAT family N-acetyltransferase [Phycisphaerales bacterium]